MLLSLYFIACLADYPGTCKADSFGPFYSAADCSAMRQIVIDRAPAEGVTIRMATCAPQAQEVRHGR